MKEIDYDVLLDNCNYMINLLEWDAMRSSGKMKLNSQHLHSLYEVKDRYVAELKTAKKPAVKSEV